MKRKLIYSAFLAFVLTILIENTYALFNWRWLTPYPTNANMKDMCFTDSLNGFAVGNCGVILHSTNGGLTWRQQNSGGNRFLSSVFFINGYTGYVTSGDEMFNAVGVVLKTTNAGITWQQAETFSNKYLGGVWFINENTGFVCGGTYWWGGEYL